MSRRKRIKELRKKAGEAPDESAVATVDEDEQPSLPESDPDLTAGPDAPQPDKAVSEVADTRAAVPAQPEAGEPVSWKENLLLVVLILYVFLLGLGTVGELFEVEAILNLPLFK